MKLTIPGIMISALILSSSAALAQNTNYQGTTSKPGASFQKDDTTVAPTNANKQMASHKKKHSKRMKSNAQTTGAGSSSNPAASTTKDDVTPKSK